MTRILKGLVFGALGAAIALLVAVSGRGEIVEAQTYDWRLVATARPADARKDIAIIEINEGSVRALEPAFGRWPWPRFVHGAVINYLARNHARMIVYDVLLSEPDFLGNYKVGGNVISGNESDAELVTAVRRAGTVVFALDAVYGGTTDGTVANGGAADALKLPGTVYAPGPGLPSRPNVELPFDALREAVSALGHNYLSKDAGGVARRMAPFIDYHGAAVPSLGLASVLLGQQVPVDQVRLEASTLRVGDARVPLVDGDLLLRFHGPFRDAKTDAETYPAYPFFNVLLDEQRILDGAKTEIDPDAFRDKIVFVGTSANGLADVHATPFGGNTPGVYLHATLADNVLSQKFMRRATRTTDVAITAVAGLAAGVLAMTLPVWWAVGAIVAVGAGLVVWVTKAVDAGLWLPMVGPLVAVTLALVGSLSWQYFVEGREKRHVKRLFGRYVSKDVFEQLMTNPSLARLGGERREMTVLFSDIRGFTTASEAGTPEGVVAQLNEYFSEMVRILFEHHGTLDKFVGDMVMGLFGAPVADARHADHAVATAIDMMAALAKLNDQWRAKGQPTVDIGIGINSGEMIAGNIGSESIMSYTVIGDAVNLGSRLESLNKEYGTHILISQATKDLLTIPVETRLVGEAHVKGRSQAVTVYEVLVRSK